VKHDAPPAYSSLRHRFAGRQLQGGEDGRDGWGGRGPGGARPPRWRRRAHARAAAADVGTEDLELISRDLAVTAAELSGWRDQFLAAGEASLKSRPADARDAEIGRLQAKVGELTMTAELLEAKIERLETHRPLGRRRSRR
jgi:hypothetical protein